MPSAVDDALRKMCWARVAHALTALVIPFLLPQGVAAQAPAGAPSASELAKQAQNPISSLISFPLEGNWDMGVGDRKATSALLNVQPVIPFPISKSTNVVRDIFSAVGTYAIGSQILYYAVLGVASYLLAFGLSYDQKAPMTLGICTRNVGPALATLMGVAGAPQGAITMCILAIFLGAILSGFAAAAMLKRFCVPAGAPAVAQAAGGV